MKVKISSEALLQGKQIKDVNDFIANQQGSQQKAYDLYNSQPNVLMGNAIGNQGAADALLGLTSFLRGHVGRVGQLGAYAGHGLTTGGWDKPIEDFADVLPVNTPEEVYQQKVNPAGKGAGDFLQNLAWAIPVGGGVGPAIAGGSVATGLMTAGSNLSAGKSAWEDLIPQTIAGGLTAGVLTKGGQLASRGLSKIQNARNLAKIPNTAKALTNRIDDLYTPTAKSAGSLPATAGEGGAFKSYTSMTETPMLTADEIAKYRSAGPNTPAPTTSRALTGTPMIPLNQPSNLTGIASRDIVNMAEVAPQVVNKAATQTTSPSFLQNIIQKAKQVKGNVSDTWKRVGKETGDYAFIRESGGGKPQAGNGFFRRFEKAYPGFTTMKNSVNDAVQLINKTVKEDVPVIVNALKNAEATGITISREEILSKVLAKRNTKVLASLKGQYGTAIDDVLATLGDADNFSISDINKIRANVGEAMGSNWDLMNKGSLPRPVYQAYRDIYVSLRNLIDRKIIQAGGPSLKAVNERVHMATEMQDFLVRNNNAYMPKSGFTGIDAIIASSLVGTGHPAQGIGAVVIKRGLQSPPAVRKVAQGFNVAGKALDKLDEVQGVGGKIKAAAKKPLQFMKDGTLKLTGEAKKQLAINQPLLRVLKTGAIANGQMILTKAGEEWSRQQYAQLPIQDDLVDETYDNQQSSGLQFLQQKQPTWEQRMTRYIQMGFTAKEAVQQIQKEDQQEFENLLALEKSSGGTIKTAAAKDMASAKSGLRAVTKLKTIIENDPTVRWQRDVMSGGPLSFIQSPNAKQFNQAAMEAIDVLARLRTGAVINDEEEARYRQYIPNMWDDAETIEYKLSVLNELFLSIAGIQNE